MRRIEGSSPGAWKPTSTHPVLLIHMSPWRTRRFPHDRGAGTRWSLRSPSTQTILWFHLHKSAVKLSTEQTGKPVNNNFCSYYCLQLLHPINSVMFILLNHQCISTEVWVEAVTYKHWHHRLYTKSICGQLILHPTPGSLKPLFTKGQWGKGETWWGLQRLTTLISADLQMNSSVLNNKTQETLLEKLFHG